MKKKRAAKLWWFARCAERVAAIHFYRNLHNRIKATLAAGASLAQCPQLG